MSLTIRPLSYYERALLAALNDSSVQYLVIGGRALSVHGVDHNPDDLDLLLGLDPDNWAHFFAVLQEVDPQPVRKTLEGAPQPKRRFRVELGPSHLDALTSIDGVEFDAAYANRYLAAIDAELGPRIENVPVISKADLITTLRSSKFEKHTARLAVLTQAFKSDT